MTFIRNRQRLLTRRLFFAVGLATLVAASFAQPPASFSDETPSPGVWPGRVFEWYYNPEHVPSWLGAEEARLLVQEAAKSWEACGLRMAYQGETQRTPGQMDRRNVVGWSMQIPKRVRGMTVGQAKDGRLLERDVLIRPDRREFERFPRLLRKVILHEFGHAIGLTHSNRCDDVMTLAADCPPRHPNQLPVAPTENDLARCRSLYPPGNEIQSR